MDDKPPMNGATEETKTARDGAAPARARRGRGFVLRSISVLTILLFLAAGLIIGGFLRFAEQIAALEEPETLDGMDAIVVLTGASQRIDSAIGLLNAGVGERLLISGVNPRTSGNQIKSMTVGSDALFDCCVDIGHDAIDTIGNANETARWISDNGYAHVLIVTSDYHIPRSLLELRRADPTTVFTPFPIAQADLKADDWLKEPDVLRLMVGEYGKYTLARLRELVGTTHETGLRTDTFEAPATVRASSGR